MVDWIRCEGRFREANKGRYHLKIKYAILFCVTILIPAMKYLKLSLDAEISKVFRLGTLIIFN